MRLPKIDRILLADGELQPVLAKARDIRALGGLVDGFFPPDLARQVRVANFREGELVLTAANPPVAAKIRLLAPSLNRYLAKQRWQVNSVSVRVQPTESPAVVPNGPAVKTVHLSTQAVKALRSLHASMGNSPARDALGALLDRHGPLILQNQQALAEQQQKNQDDDDEGHLEQAPRQHKPFALSGHKPKEDADRKSNRDQKSDETNDEH
jgi:hypothetical protein